VNSEIQLASNVEVDGESKQVISEETGDPVVGVVVQLGDVVDVD